jgi:hypothetical protein
MCNGLNNLISDWIQHFVDLVGSWVVSISWRSISTDGLVDSMCVEWSADEIRSARCHADRTRDVVRKPNADEIGLSLLEGTW